MRGRKGQKPSNCCLTPTEAKWTHAMYFNTYSSILIMLNDFKKARENIVVKAKFMKVIFHMKEMSF